MHPSKVWYGRQNSGSSPAPNQPPTAPGSRRSSQEALMHNLGTPPSQHTSVTVLSTGSPRTSFAENDIWTPIFPGSSASGASSIRGNSFGSYGSLSFDSERYKQGNAAWGSADEPRRRMASFPAAEPVLESVGRFNEVLDFTSPQISVLERFGRLGEMTLNAELRQQESQEKVPVPIPAPLRNDKSFKLPTGPAKTPQTLPSGPGINEHTQPRRRRRKFEANRIEDLLGGVYEASTDQHGSRFIQDRLPAAPLEIQHQLLTEILPHALALATDVFGNYVVQLLFQIASPPDRSSLMERLHPEVHSLSLHMYGCRVIQNALQFLENEGRLKVVFQIKDSILQCVKDHNGNHVVQKAIEFVEPDQISFVYSEILEQTLKLSKHMYGCRVIQRCLEFSPPNTKLKFLKCIKDHLDSLVLDQYGNYVVQHVVEHGPRRDREFVLQQLSSRVVQLSSHKYASNVVERCFVKGTAAQREAMVDAIITEQVDGEPAVLVMMKDQYANYVIQRILTTAKDSDYERLSAAVKRNLPAIKKSQQGKHLLAIERRLR